MIICDELPFKHVERLRFKRFVVALNPRLDISSWFTVQRDCYVIYRAEKDKLIKFLKTSKQWLCITIAIWSSVQQINYVGITVHYIDENWNFCKKLLSFATIESHWGADIAITVEKILRPWEISKIFTITIGNSSSNDVVIRYLKDEYGSKKGSIFGGEFMHMRCVVHILNLVCVDGLKLKNTPKSVLRIREVVRYVSQSPARKSIFNKCMHMKGDQSKVELVWKMFEKEDSCFFYEMMSENHDKVGVPEASDWDYIRRLHDFLQCFYEVTLKISDSKYVTSNLFYHEIIGLVITLKKWMESDNVHMSRDAIKIKDKFDKYWGRPEKMNMLIFIAAIMDPRYKLKFVEFTMYFLHDDPQMVDLMKEKIKEFLYKLFNYYKEEVTTPISDERINSCSEVTSSSISDMSFSASVAMM